MTFLIISDNTNTQKQTKYFVQKYFGEAAPLYQAFSYTDALSIIKNNNPKIILSSYKVNEHSIFKIVEQYSATPKRNYFLLDKKEAIAVKAIRCGFRGMFNIDTDVPQLLKAIEQINNTEQELNLDSVLKQLDELQNNKLIIQHAKGFDKVSLNDLLYIEDHGSYLQYVLKHGKTIKSKQNLFLVANQINQKHLKIVSWQLIINTANISSITPKNKNCNIIFDDNSLKEITNINLDILFNIVQETNNVQ